MKRLFIVCAVLMILPCLALAQLLPDTGQTKCYDNIQEIPCPQPGESFYGQDAQHPCNLQSYTKLDDNGNDLPDEATEWVMVRDNVTGLVWEVKQDKDAIQNYENPHDADNRYTWYDGVTGTPGDGTDTQDFIDALNTSQFGGFNDWRMPTIKDLSFIRNMNTYDPAINTDYFPNTVSTYWSSNSYGSPLINMQRYYFRFSDGFVSHNVYSATHYVRAVRSGQFSNNFVDNGDGTVTDTSTGLMWQQATAAGAYRWEEALSYCENLSLAGYNDWRLPDINELHSNVDYSVLPSIDTTYFPNTETAVDYWSSTTSARDTDYVVHVWFASGLLLVSNKHYYRRVWAVRTGLCGVPGDSDYDGICDDGDDNGTPGDNPCTGGETVGCDDNCLGVSNPHQEDTDSDSVGDACDNCPDDSNPVQEDFDGDVIGDVCDECTDTDYDGFGNPGFPTNTCGEDNCPNDYNPDQEDTYPPQGNGIGDACDCESNFNCDGNVDADDATAFITDFGRHPFCCPCTNENPCNGDFNCDNMVAADDVAKFLEDFGRNQFNNPCPACEVGDWCVYE